MGWRVTAVLSISATLLPMTSCAGTGTPLTERAWCDAVQEELTELGVGWPVANRKLDERQIAGIERTFEELAHRADGDLEIAAKGWLQGFQAAKPYLLTGDLDGFNAEVSEPLRQQLRLVNVTINNICGWEEW